MNRRMIAYLVGTILLVESVLMIPSLLIGVFCHEPAGRSFIVPMLILVLTGIGLTVTRPRNTRIYARDAYMVVSLGWVFMSLAGAMPFYLSKTFPTIWDCIFEIVSGFTTTGASILAEPEKLPRCILFWRSFSHWIGGMGVLVFVLAVAPMSGERSMHLMRAEAPGPVVGKLVPRMRKTAQILYLLYTGMTVTLVLLLLAGGLPVFDAFCYAFATAGTGGFGITSAGLSVYHSAYVEMVVSVFMLLFGMNFNLFYLLIIGRVREALRSEELHAYLLIFAGSVLVFTFNILHLCSNFAEALRLSIFQASSIMTSTGFATADFANEWPQMCQHLLLFLMLIGACAGSTGGGLKVSRMLLLVKSGMQEIRRLIHPRLATVVHMDGASMDRDALHETRTYIFLYVAILALSTLFLSVDGLDFTTNFSAAVSCVNNIGPGLGLVGPAGNYSIYSPFSKMLLSLCMLVGRLEIYPIIILFSPGVWKRNT